MITVEVIYDAADYARAMTFIRNQNIFRRNWYVLFGVWTVGASVLLYLLDAELKVWGYLLTFVCVVVVLVLTMPLFLRREFRKQLKNAPAAQGTQRYTFDEEGIEAVGSLGSSQFKWAAVIKALEGRDDFFFFLSKNFAHFIPIRAFSSSEQQSSLRGLVREKLGDRAKLG
jgi:Ca2+/Na+ antiporter